MSKETKMEVRNRRIKLAASMLCADQSCLISQIKEIESAGVDMLHIDIMDGHFVPNMTGGSDYANEIRANANVVCDYHFMVEKPLKQIDMLEGVQCEDRISFHVECRCDSLKVLDQIHKTGAKAGLAMNPGTPIAAVEPYLKEVDYILLLIVNPGFKGQPMIPRTLEKLSKLKGKLQELDRQDVEILVDGAVTLDNMLKIVDSGADNLVCGPFTCFNEKLGGIEPTLFKVKEKLKNAGFYVEAECR